MDFQFQGRPRFSAIPSFTKSADYMVHVGLGYLVQHYTRYVVDYGLDVCPDFQRGYVWRPEQKIRFMEYLLRGGTSGLDIYCNSPTWRVGELGPKYHNSWLVLVDGKQRLDAAMGFLNDEFRVFGALYSEFEDRPRITQANFRWHVNDLQTRGEVLQWYLDLNSGGTVHTAEELANVRSLIQASAPYVKPSFEEILESANVERQCVQRALEVLRREEEERRTKSAQATVVAPKPKRGKKQSD